MAHRDASARLMYSVPVNNTSETTGTVSTLSGRKEIKRTTHPQYGTQGCECKTEGAGPRGMGISDEQVARNESETRSVKAVQTCPKREVILDATAQALVAASGYSNERRGTIQTRIK